MKKIFKVLAILGKAGMSVLAFVAGCRVLSTTPVESAIMLSAGLFGAAFVMAAWIIYPDKD